MTAGDRPRRTGAERQAAYRARRAAEAAQIQASVDAELRRQAELELAELDRVMAQHSIQPEGPHLVDRVLAGSKALLLLNFGNPLIRTARLAATPTEALAAATGARWSDVRSLQLKADEMLADRIFGRVTPQAQPADAGLVPVQFVLPASVVAQMQGQQDQALTGRVVELLDSEVLDDAG